MTIKSYIWGMRFITLVSVIALVLVIFYINPEDQDITGKIFFYLTAFFLMSGLFNLILLSFRGRMIKDGGVAENISLSFRQGVLLSAATVGILILQSMRALVWWDALLVVAGMFLVELYFLSLN